jgi:signal transduction histidine kinase/FixJ family two-component response regulator
LVMELGIYDAIENILGIYSSVAVAWVGALVADLVINKPLGLSPKHIEFKRAHLYDINPVGVGAMLIASILGVTSYAGEFGELAQALSPYIALVTAFIVSPIIAMVTKGRYYIARPSSVIATSNGFACCKVCQNEFEVEDMAACPAYGGAICSLCCSLDVRCHDQCKINSRLGDQSAQFISAILPQQLVSKMNARMLQFLGLFTLITAIIAALFMLVYLQGPKLDPDIKFYVSSTLIQLFFILLIIVGVLTWLFVLANESRQFALAEYERQTELLSKEVGAHKETDHELQQAKETAEAANQAKSRYLTGISHELRSPLNSMLGYAQLLEKDKGLTETLRNKAKIIRRSGDHLADIIEGLLDISRIEAGRIEFRRDQVPLQSLIDELIEMFHLQADAKDIQFEYSALSAIPNVVTADEKHLRQILINLLSNAVKFTEKGRVSLSVSYRNQVAVFTISDTGVGIAPLDEERVFEPFERIRTPSSPNVQGTGLGLTISKLLTEIMGGEILLTSEVGVGSSFRLALMLPRVFEPNIRLQPVACIESYIGEPKTIMVVDDDAYHRGLISEILIPLGFIVLESPEGSACCHYQHLEQVDLFLLDISMPGMSGLSLVETLREKGISAPIIMVSADAYETTDDLIPDNKIRSYDEYITKPIRDSILLDKLANALNLEWCYEANTETRTSSESVNAGYELNDHDLFKGVTEKDFRELISLAEIGFIDGINHLLLRLDQIGGAERFVTNIRQYLVRYQFETIISISKRGLLS